MPMEKTVNEAPENDANRSKVKRKLVLFVLVFLFSSLFLAIWGLWVNKLPQEEASVLSEGADSVVRPTTPPPPKEDLLAAAEAAGCDLSPGEISFPTSMTMIKDGRELEMMTLGRDETDAAGAPPIKDAYVVGWFHEGPKLGSAAGKAVLTSHTYFKGRAFGNELNEGLWNPGDIVKFSDDKGNNACYSYSSNLHILEENYDPDSDIVYDQQSKPMFALVVCSDWDPYGNPLGRVIYYGDLLKR